MISRRDSPTEGETRLLRGRLIYGGEDSSTEARLFSIKSRFLASMKDKGQRARDVGKEDGKQE
jgi:hypothetical protein